MTATTPPRHAPITALSVKDGELLIGNIPISKLALRVGQTPFYAYDRNAISQRVMELRKYMPPKLKIHYAMKANPMPAVVHHMARLVDGFDLASANEMKVALDTGMESRNISFAGPGKRPHELQQAIAAEVTLNVESVHELNTIAKICEQIGVNAKVALRINPAFELKASGMKMGGGAKQFGIDEELIPSVLKQVKNLGLEFQGFHIYSGSQNLKAASIIDAQQKSLNLAIRLAEYCPSPILKLNIGGGFGIPYFPGDTNLDLEEIGVALSQELETTEKQLPETEFIVELGRFLIGEAGVYVTQVIDKKQSRDQVFLIVDGGLHHHLAASGNFGQVIRKNYPVSIGNKMNGPNPETVNIVGPLCTPLDILADKVDLPKADIGDLVVVYQSGAYGLTASPNGFLSQPRAEEVLV